MYNSTLLDHAYLVSIVVISITVIAAIYLFRLSHRVAIQNTAMSQIAAFGAQLTMIVLVVLWLSNLFGAVRDRDQRAWTLRQEHLAKLQAVLRADEGHLLTVADRAKEVGRISNFNNGTAPNTAELASLFEADILTADLANHYQEYWQDRQQLWKDIQRQDAEFGDTVARVSKPVYLPSYAENHRITVGRAVLEKCMGKGSGFTLEVSKDSYGYRFPGGGGGSSSGSNVRPPEDLTAIFAGFQSITLTAETIEHCDALRKGAASIAAKAAELTRKVKVLAERTVLTGDCEYTKLDE